MSTISPLVARSDRRWVDYLKPITIPFWGVHLFAIAGIVWSGWSWSGFALAVLLYYVRMFFITAAYHRYFAHRSYKTSRWFQFLLALGGTSAAQKGPLWWASHHRTHHRFSDLPGDVHSAKRDGLFWSHVGWIIVRDYEETDESKIRDMARYPELRWLNRWHLVAPIALAVGLALVGGFHALLWGFFVSTMLLWHGTFTINSLSHIFGRRRYATTDESKNNWFLALITMGEGWHNNHHYYMSSANQGFYWWEVDASYWILRALSWVGLVWDLRTPPAHVRDATLAAESKPVEAELDRAA